MNFGDIIDFGKYKGRVVQDLPKDYITWLQSKGYTFSREVLQEVGLWTNSDERKHIKSLIDEWFLVDRVSDLEPLSDRIRTFDAPNCEIVPSYGFQIAQVFGAGRDNSFMLPLEERWMILRHPKWYQYEFKFWDKTVYNKEEHGEDTVRYTSVCYGRDHSLSLEWIENEKQLTIYSGVKDGDWQYIVVGCPTLEQADSFKQACNGYKIY
ncbi:DUF3820 family protein [Candidatus Woesebacteria bacterium]|nr:DUF3820 family protein [Candidatus Woesebacteria bacterium]